MTSLKTISTMLRKTKLLLIFILMMVVMPLWADSYRIGVLGEDTEYCGIIKESLEIISQVYSEDAILRAKERNEAIKHQEYLLKRSSDLLSENFSSLNAAEVPYQMGDTLQIEVVTLNVDDGVAAFLRKGDKDAFSYVALSENLDALFFVKADSVASIRDITVLMDGEIIREVPYVNSLHAYEEKALLDLFASLYLDDVHHVYAFTVDPSSSALVVDGESVVSGYAMLREGLHSFALEAYGYKGIQESRELTGEETSVSFLLEPSLPHDLYVSTKPWNASVYFNGSKMEGKTLSGIYAPYTLSLSAEGFANASYQTRKDVEKVEISMKPAWGKDNDVMMDKKAEFYRSLFYTIGFFGTYCATNSLSNIYVDNAALKPVSVVLGGVSLVSLVYLVQSAVDYFSAAGLGL